MLIRRLVRPRRRRARCRDSRGSGTAIGVAVIFPMLMILIVSLDAIITSSRTSQAMQAAADRAAQTAALCCLHVDDAEDAVTDSVVWLEQTKPYLNVACLNSMSADAVVYFQDVDGNEVEIGSGEVVPPGGMVRVRLTCRLAPRALGPVRILTFRAEHNALSTAVIDPYRHRFDHSAATP